MINHARTLLVNVSGSSQGYDGFPGDEYIPPSFTKIPAGDLSSAVKNIRSLLFGADPDRVYLNYMARKYLALLHSTELLEFVTDLDPRITYDVDNEDLFPAILFHLEAPDDDIFIVGETGAPDELGRALHKWKVEVTSSSTVTVTRQTKPLQHSVQDYTVDDNLSSLIDLVGSAAQVRVRPTVGLEWNLSTYARPERNLGQVAVDIKAVGEVYMNDLFGVGSTKASTEPFKTFRNLWNNHPELAYQLGGVLLAVLYRMDEARIKDG